MIFGLLCCAVWLSLKRKTKSMIRNKTDKPRQQKLELDLTGPDGNAFVLMAHANTIGRQLGYSRQRITAIRKVMMMGDYEGLVKVFDREFGDHVILWR